MWSEFVAFVSGVGIVAFYSMVRREKTTPGRAAEHRLRGRLLQWIRGRPGIRLAELWRAAGAPRGTVQYHLLVLERAERVRSMREPRTRRYFPLEGGPPADVLAALLAGRILEMVALVLDHPGWCQQDFMRALKLRRKTVRRYADRLAAAQLVKEQRDQFRLRYFPTPRLKEVLPEVLGREGPPATSDPPGGPEAVR